MATLSDLTSRYLDGDVAVSVETTKVEPLIDGKAYFEAVYTAIESTAGGDVVYILGWAFDDKMTGPRTTGIGDLLADKAKLGVDVRVILTAGVYLQYQKRVGPFAENFAVAQRLRALTRGGTKPLAARVVLDWSGQRASGTHHQKAVLVKIPSLVQAFVSGLDFLPSRYDARPHTELTWGTTAAAWGWHDAGVRLTGKAVERVWENFRSRWYEAARLPQRSYYKAEPVVGGEEDDVSLVQVAMNPASLPVDVSVSPTVDPVASPGRAVQVLRSRYPFKRLPERWSETPDKGIFEVASVLKKAIGAAQRYVYVEDQFLADSLTFGFVPPGYSLFPELLQVVRDKPVKLILVGSDVSDPTDLGAGPRNQTIAEAGDVKDSLLDELGSPKSSRVTVWRVAGTTVHSKIVIVDDEFAAIGSANLHSRSMYGIDSELQVAFVDANPSPDSVVKQLRVDLWAEHLRLPLPLSATLQAQLDDLDTALGIWRTSWLPPGSDQSMWRVTGHPAGFDASVSALEPVEPGD